MPAMTESDALRPLKVAMFSDYFPPHVGGGVEKVVYEVAKGLAAEGVDVDVFTLRTAGGPDLETMDGFRVHRSGSIDLTKAIRLQSAVSPRMVQEAYQKLRANPPDVIHAHNTFFFSSLVAAGVAKLLRRPLVTTLHLGSLEALPLPQRLPVLAYERSLGRAIVTASDRVICVSEAVAAYATKLGARPERTSVQLNAVDSATFHPGVPRHEGSVRIGFVGRLIQNKGPQYLVEALPALFERHPQTELWFVGDGPLRASLEQRCNELGVSGQVRFFGTREDVDDILRQCDIFVRPSLMEGLSLTILEAMATGLPVIATDVGGTKEAVDEGRTGLLVPPSDVPALADALISLIEAPERRVQMGAAARARIEQDFGWQRIVKDSLDTYVGALAERELRWFLHAA